MKKYPIPDSSVSSRVREMPSVTATQLKNSTADVIDQLASQGALAITKHEKPRAVLLSLEEYEALAGLAEPDLSGLRAEYRRMLEEMQSPEQREAAKRLFSATPEELGAAAVRGAQRQTGRDT